MAGIEKENLRFKITFNVISEDITFEDMIKTDYNTVYGHTLSDVKGIIKITSPLGVIYSNVGWSTNDFSNPDIDGNVPQWTKGGISIPLLNGLPVSGYYSVEYKISVDGGSSVKAELTGTDAKKYNMGVTKPSIEINREVSCISSQILFEDKNNYTITDSENNTISPSTISRAWKIVYPESVLPNVTSNSASVLIGKNSQYNNGVEIYRGVYYASLESTITYELESWGNFSWVNLSIEVSTSIVFEVECPDCSCNYYTCLKALELRKENAREAGNFVDVGIIEKTIQKINWYWSLYNLAIRCGQDASAWCEKIKTFATATAECCEDEDDSTPTKVTAWVTAISGNGGSGTRWYFREGIDGHISSPNDGDAEMFVSTSGSFFKGDIYYYTDANGWVYEGNMSGSADTVLKMNEISDMPDVASSSLQKISGAEYTIKAGTLATDGDCVELELGASIASNVDVTFYIYCGSVKVFEYSNFYSPNVEYVTIKATINRFGNTALMATSEIIQNGEPSTIVKPSNVYALSGVDWSSDTSLAFYIQKVDSGNAGDVTCKYYKVKIYKL